MKPIRFFLVKAVLLTVAPMLTALNGQPIPCWLKTVSVVAAAGVSGLLSYLLKTQEPGEG